MDHFKLNTLSEYTETINVFKGNEVLGSLKLLAVLWQQSLIFI